MAAGFVDRRGFVSHYRSAATPRSDDAEVVWAALAGLIRTHHSAELPARVCGVGCGGPMTLGGAEVSPLNIGAWRNFPLRDRLAELTGLTVAVENDAKALALAEATWGAGTDERNFIALVVSTGVGGGVVLDGRLLDGRLGNAGHIGHVMVEPLGRRCSCGAFGCLEAEASGSAIESVTGRPASEASPEVIERCGTLVGRAVASVANLLDLRLAVVAGSVALGFGDPFFGAAQAEVDRRARLDFSAGTRVVPAGLGSLGPIAGAGAVGWRSVDAPVWPGAR
jgi:glucokinase